MSVMGQQTAQLKKTYLKLNALSESELSGFTCTSSPTMNEKFSSGLYSDSKRGSYPDLSV